MIQACRKIYELKSRPSNNPIIVHVSNIEMARRIGRFNDLAEVLAKTFWPGPLTIILPIRVWMLEYAKLLRLA
jgi:L-threonylcarbamoyladenylate synthase